MVLGWPLAATGAWALADGSATNPAASRTAVAIAKETLPRKRGMQSSPSNIVKLRHAGLNAER